MKVENPKTRASISVLLLLLVVIFLMLSLWRCYSSLIYLNEFGAKFVVGDLSLEVSLVLLLDLLVLGTLFLLPILVLSGSLGPLNLQQRLLVLLLVPVLVLSFVNLQESLVLKLQKDRIYRLVSTSRRYGRSVEVEVTVALLMLSCIGLLIWNFKFARLPLLPLLPISLVLVMLILVLTSRH